MEAIGPHAKAAAPALGKLLRDEGEHPAFRTEAANVLGKMGADAKQAVPDLVEALGDKQESVRLAAAQALAEIGAEAKPAVPVLIKLLSGPDLQLRRAAARALAHKELQTKDAIPALTELLKHEFPWLRAEAAVTLSKMGPETAKLAIPALTAAVPDRNACVALAALGPETAKIGIPPLIASLTQDLQSRYGRIDREAIQAVREAGPEAVKAAIPVIMPLLKHQDKDVRRNAFSVLAMLGAGGRVGLARTEGDAHRQGRRGPHEPLSERFGGWEAPRYPSSSNCSVMRTRSVRHSAAFHLGRFGEHMDNSGRYATVALRCPSVFRRGTEAAGARGEGRRPGPGGAAARRQQRRLLPSCSGAAANRSAGQCQGRRAAACGPIAGRQLEHPTRRDRNPGQMRPESNAAIPVLSELLGDKDLAVSVRRGEGAGEDGG